MAYMCAENGNLMAIAQQLVQQQQQQHQQQHHQQQIYASANLSGYFGREGGSVGNMGTPWLPNPVWHEGGVGFPSGFCSEVLGDLCSTTTTSYLSEPNSVLDLSRASMAFSPMEQFHEFGHRLQDGISSKQLMCLAGGMEPPPPDFKESSALYHDCLVKKERPVKEGSADSGLKLGNCGAGDSGLRPCSVFRLPELQTFVFDSPVASTRNEFVGPDVCTEWMDCLMTDLQPEAGNNNNNNNNIASCFDSNPCESTESSELPGAANGGGGGGYPCNSEDAWQNEFGVLGEAFASHKRSPPTSWTPDNTTTELLCSSPSADMLSAASSELLSSSSLKGKAALQEQYSGGGHDFKPLHSMATVQNVCSVQLKKEPTGVSSASQKWQQPSECLNVKREEDCKGEADVLENHVQGQGSQLVHSLLDCAKIIDTEPERASKSITHLRTISSPRGDPTQRVVSYFADALAKRLSMGVEQQQQQVESLDEKCFEESTLAYKALNDACPYSKFAHLTANQAILEAMEKAEKIHIIDFGIVQGVQWAALFASIRNQGGRETPENKNHGDTRPLPRTESRSFSVGHRQNALIPKCGNETHIKLRLAQHNNKPRNMQYQLMSIQLQISDINHK